MYGGYYSAYAGASDEETIKGLTYTDGTATDTAGTPYAGSRAMWVEEETYPTIGTKMVPKGGKIYYLKEVPETYLMPYAHCTFYTSNMKVTKMWYVSAIDVANYSGTGFIIKDVKTGATKVCNSLSVKAQNGGSSTKLVPTELFDIPEGYLTYYASTNIEDAEVRQYWETLDDILVEGPMKRIYTTGDGTLNTDTGYTVETVPNV